MASLAGVRQPTLAGVAAPAGTPAPANGAQSKDVTPAPGAHPENAPSDKTAADKTVSGAALRMDRSQDSASSSTGRQDKADRAADAKNSPTVKDLGEEASGPKPAPIPMSAKEPVTSDKTQSEAEKKMQVAGLEQKPRIESTAKSSISEALLTLVFPNRAFSIDPATSAEIKDFLKQSSVGDGKGKLLVRAQAFVGNGSITESRRIAYYRAMMVRKELIAAGIPADKISLHVDETQDPKKENVQIMADH
jgi:hypothetical protein